MTRPSYVGQPMRRPDAPDKATGRARYIQDLERPGMLYGKIKFSQHAHARILHIDTSLARGLPGVRAVITAADTPEVRLGFLRDNFALKCGKVRQFRDEVAAVAAIDPDIAAQAVELIRVEYEPLPAVFTPESAMAPGAPLIHERDSRGRPRTDNLVPVTFKHDSGDLAQARLRSAHVVESVYSTPLIQQSCMGTAGCIAEFDLSGNLSIWAKTQIPFLAQRDFMGALEALGLHDRNVRVVVPTLGGAFGTGLDTHTYEYIAILLAHRTGRPVKIIYDRQEEFACLSPRQSTRVRVAQGCDSQGRLTFRDLHVTQDNGAYVSWGATYPSVMLVPATSLYKVPVVRFDSTLVYTNNTYAQAMRGYGNPEVTWAIESNLDDLAREAGVDPLEMRRINCNEPGEITPMGLKVKTCAMDECIERAAQQVDWHATRPAGRGVGMAALCHVGGSGRIYRSDASGVIIRFDDFGNVYVASGSVEMGQGQHTALTQGVADYLGVRPRKVFITQTDTSTCPWDVGTHASRGAFTSLNAVAIAARKARKRIFELAVQLYPDLVGKQIKRHGASHPGQPLPRPNPRPAPDDFDLRDGFIFPRERPDEPLLKLELARLLRAAHFREGGELLVAHGFYDPPTELPDWTRGVGDLSAAYAYGAHAVELEVDRQTGEIHILRLAAVHDVGRVLNPQTLRGQIYGALAQGLGYALYEEVLTREGRILNDGFTDYKIPTAREMAFPIHLDFMETLAPEGPFGAKGVGEPGLVPTTPAIANAIYDAIGVRIRHLPITPEKILDAIARAERS